MPTDYEVSREPGDLLDNSTFVNGTLRLKINNNLFKYRIVVVIRNREGFLTCLCSNKIESQSFACYERSFASEKRLSQCQRTG